MRAYGRLTRLERAYALRRLRSLSRGEIGEVQRLIEAFLRDGRQALGATQQARMKALARLLFVELP
jgi:hypothetical protein